MRTNVFLFIIASAAHGHLLCAVLGGKYHQFEPEASKSQGAGYLNQDLIFFRPPQVCPLDFKSQWAQ